MTPLECEACAGVILHRVGRCRKTAFVVARTAIDSSAAQRRLPVVHVRVARTATFERGPRSSSSGRIVTLLATHARVTANQRKACRGMVELTLGNLRETVGGVTRRTRSTQPTGVRIGVATAAVFVRHGPEPWPKLTLRTRALDPTRHQVARLTRLIAMPSGQREPCTIVIERRRGVPAAHSVAAIATGAELTFMRIDMAGSAFRANAQP